MAGSLPRSSARYCSSRPVRSPLIRATTIPRRWQRRARAVEIRVIHQLDSSPGHESDRHHQTPVGQNHERFGIARNVARESIDRVGVEPATARPREHFGRLDAWSQHRIVRSLPIVGILAVYGIFGSCQIALPGVYMDMHARAIRRVRVLPDHRDMALKKQDHLLCVAPMMDRFDSFSISIGSAAACVNRVHAAA